jgi:peptide deformylase
MEVVQAPDERLRVKCKPIKKITPSILKTFKEMVKLTRSFKDPEGVGLASTQVGEDGQFFVVRNHDDTFTVIINPKILSYSKKTKVYLEGCLSIAHYWGEVERHLAVTVTYEDLKGNTIKKRLTGVAAWIFQHEFDHINGRLYMDHVLANKARLFKVVGKDKAGDDIFQEVVI